MYISTAIHSLVPEAEFVVEGNSVNKIRWLSQNIAQPSEEQIQAKIAELIAAEPLRLLRQQRNQLLAQSDWMAVSDRTMTQSQIDYRQALRDITTQTPSLDENGQLTGITWPTLPTD